MNAQLKPLDYCELLIGSGSRRARLVHVPGRYEGDFRNLTTLDLEPRHTPDVVHDLERLPWPFQSDAFDEVHAYEVLEHLGQQGDARSFFAHFTEIWRILKPGGVLVATCPSLTSPWLWGDPSHRRVICGQSLTFLSQPEYDKQVGKTPMSDFRALYQADFDVMSKQDNGEHFGFVLQAVKPSRISV